VKRHLRDQLIVSMVVLVLVPSAFYLVYTLNLLNALLVGQSETRLEELARMAEYKAGEGARAGRERAAVAATLRQFVQGAESWLLDTGTVGIDTAVVRFRLDGGGVVGAIASGDDAFVEDAHLGGAPGDAPPGGSGCILPILPA